MDGLRGLFFILVFLSHGCQHYDPQLQQHWLKPVVQFGAVHDHSLVMAFFFVMSSFLITLLLLRESHLQGRIHIGAFYLRRLLRIWPLYVLILGIGFGLYPWLRSFGSHAYTETARLPMYLLFLQNLDWAEHPPSFPGLGVLWSLAIEEQFYLVWPVLLAVVPRRALPYTLLAVLAAVLSWQATHSFRGFHTLTCASDLVVGGLAAVAVFAAQQRRHPLARRWLLAVRQQPAWLVGLLYVVGVYLYRHGLHEAPAAVQPAERLLVDVLAVAVLLEQNYGRFSLFKLGNVAPLRQLGRLAYGLYMWHAVALVGVDEVFHQLAVPPSVWYGVLTRPVLAFGLSVVGAILSFRYVELPFLRLYARLMPRPAQPEPAHERLLPAVVPAVPAVAVEIG